MAEAVVAPVPTRFYCHMCNVEINIPNTDFTCPLCAGGFVEELPARPPPNSASSSSTTLSGANSRNSSDYSRLADLDAIRGEIATLLMSRNGPNVEISIDPGSRRANLLTLGAGMGSGTSVGGGTGGGRVRPPNMDRLDNVLLDFLQGLSGGDVDGTFSNPQMFYMGNLGDYAWGREGIDTIVTQLLNQMETTGPPPLPKDKIAEIPKVEITSEEAEKKLQCSVCWEDFKAKELVRKLPCSHVYHENCIVPWLDLHGTCPICRKSLIDDGDADQAAAENQGAGGSGSQPSGLLHLSGCPMDRFAAMRNGRAGAGNAGGGASGSASIASTSAQANQEGEGTGTTGGSNGRASSSNQTTQRPPHRNNVFSFDEGNEDLD